MRASREVEEAGDLRSTALTNEPMFLVCVKVLAGIRSAVLSIEDEVTREMIDRLKSYLILSHSNNKTLN